MFRVLKLCNYISIDPHLRNIKSFGIEPSKVVFNPNIPRLYQDTFLMEKPADPYTKTSFVSTKGALCAYSGQRTERFSKNSRVVKDSKTEKEVQWNQSNIPIDEPTYDLVQKLAVDYINHRPKLYLVDGYYGWDPNHRLKVRSYCTRTYHALFLRNILVRPTIEEIQKDFSSGADVTIFNGGQLNVSKNTTGTEDGMLTAINLSQQKITILGTQFAGEMKKALFKMSSHLLPRKGILTLRGSAITTKNNNVTLMIGLPGAGKGSLALHAQKNKLVANDEVAWSNEGIYNLEGGVYARILNLRNKIESQVESVLRFGAVVENANPMRTTRNINFHDVSVTENARLCYPLTHLPAFEVPAMDSTPKNVILLTCDLQGVLPPVAKLTKEQAVFYYLNGYTALLNNKQLPPKNIFSTCYSSGASTLKPSIYAQLFHEKISKSNCNVWLVNTGWTGGKQGIGKRIPSGDSVKIVNAINNGQLDNSETYTFPSFNLRVPKSVNGVNEKIMTPGSGWANKSEYDEALKSLARKFQQNYKEKFEGKIDVNISSAVPTA